jgi:hypothetical protein
MTKMNIHKPYIKTNDGYKEYVGGPTFNDSPIVCCGKIFIREPVDVAYIPVKNGKILVRVNSDNGRMIVTDEVPDYVWKSITDDEMITTEELSARIKRRYKPSGAA